MNKITIPSVVKQLRTLKILIEFRSSCLIGLLERPSPRLNLRLFTRSSSNLRLKAECESFRLLVFAKKNFLLSLSY